MVVVARYRRGPANGPVLGVASGTGFAALETMGYAVTVLVQTRGNIAAVDGDLVLRGLLSPVAHMAWTGRTAAALWRWARLGHGPWWLVGTYIVAVALHTVWDSVGALVVYVVLAGVAFASQMLAPSAGTHPRSACHRSTPMTMSQRSAPGPPATSDTADRTTSVPGIDYRAATRGRTCPFRPVGQPSLPASLVP